MKLGRKLAVLVSTFAIGTTCMGGMTCSASTLDHYFNNFSVAPSPTYRQLPQIVAKDNYTSVFLHITSGSRQMCVQTWGCSQSSFASNQTLNASGSRVTSVHCNIGQKYGIKNRIKESGYNYAGLTFTSTSSVAGDLISGRWSGDSVYEDGMITADDK